MLITDNLLYMHLLSGKGCVEQQLKQHYNTGGKEVSAITGCLARSNNAACRKRGTQQQITTALAQVRQQLPLPRRTWLRLAIEMPTAILNVWQTSTSQLMPPSG